MLGFKGRWLGAPGKTSTDRTASGSLTPWFWVVQSGREGGREGGSLEILIGPDLKFESR